MADTLIKKGEVMINGKTAVIGQQVESTDTVTISDSAASLPTHYQYFLYHKPVGIVSHNPQEGEKSIEDVSGLGKTVFPVGRLDKASRGLMLLTDDGRIVHRFLNPEFAHEREYAVRVDKRITDSALSRMERGVRIEGYLTKPARIRRLSDTAFSLTLTEGKRHQIRRMCAALGYAVRDLARTRMAHLQLNNLPEGKNRPLTEDEKAILLQDVLV